MVRFSPIALLGCFMFLMSCDAIYEQPEVVYLIKAGQHQSNVEGSLPSNGLRSLKSESLTFTARFDETAKYDLNGNDQDDVNKLFGYSDCNSQHHENSARFGWAYNLDSEQVDIYAYTYTAGQREVKLLGATDINETNVYKLYMVGSDFVFEFKNAREVVKRGSNCDVGLYYMLFPYFGGNQKAPHDIRIYIQEL